MKSLSFYEQQHIQKLLQQQGSVKYLFDDFVRQAGPLLARWSDNNKASVWVGNQSVENSIERLLSDLHSGLLANITDNMVQSWNRGNKKADDLVSGFIKDLSISDTLRDKMFSRNAAALNAMLNKKDEYGLTVSDRVWNIANGAKDNLEYYLASGLSSSRPSALISQDVRQLLQNPDRCFHRVRDKNGNLVPSQPMKDYHPGQGVYRSAYKNALRLTSTQTNRAFRMADHDRWQNMDFVLGIEVKRSSSKREPCNICDALAGLYPKEFIFAGWHPFCICYAVPIMMNHEEFADFLLDGKIREKKIITSLPAGAEKFIQDNEEQLFRTKPYWYKDNFAGDTKPYFFAEASKKNKRVKTDEEKINIQNRWDERSVRNFNQKKIEENLQIRRGVTMTFEEANELKGNVNYDKGKEYSVNCQSCVVANELRRRGYDVTAMPNLQKAGNIPYELSKKTNWVWIDPKTMTMPVKEKAGGPYDVTKTGAIKSKNLSALNKELSELVKDPGRYHIDFAWKGSNTGHIITLERFEDGKLVFYDPQNGKIINWSNLSKKIKLQYGVNILRVDNLLVNTDIIDGVVKKL